MEAKKIKLYCIVDEDMSTKFKSYRIKLLNKKGYLKLNTFEISENLEIGDIILLNNVRINTNEKYFNYDSFFKTCYYKSKEIYGSINAKEENIKILGESKNIHYKIKNIGLKARKKLEGSFNNIPNSEQEIVKGIVFGDENLEYDEKQKFSNLGIIHIMAVSGFNLGIIYVVLNFILNKVVTCLKRFKLENVKFKNLIIMFFIWSFALVTGFGDSILRASLMMSVFLVSEMLELKCKTINSLWIAVLIILFLNPFSIYSLGLYLSAGSVMGLILFYDRIKFLSKYVAGTVAAQILIIPILIMAFNQVSYICILTNIVAVPISSILTITGIMTSIVGVFNIKIAFILNGINYCLAKLLLVGVDFLDGLVKGNVDVGDLNFFEIFYYYLAIVIVFIKGLRYRKQILISSLAVFLAFDIFIYLGWNDVAIYFIDVGQGDSIYIKSKNNKNILIDGGGIPKWQSSSFDVGKRVVEPFLRSKGCKNLDLVVATHCHEDHIGGLYTIIKDYNVKRIMLSKYMNQSEEYDKLLKLIKSKNIHIIYPIAGDKFSVDGLNFSVLNPQSNRKFVDTHSDDNNNSIVLKMQYKKFGILLTGDIEKEAEEVLDKKFPKEMQSDALKVGHHGSKFSTSRNFLKIVSPQVAVISVGYHNSFGHPAKSTLNRIKSVNSKIYRTDMDGCVIIYTDGNTQRVEAMK